MLTFHNLYVSVKMKKKTAIWFKKNESDYEILFN